MLPSAIRNDQIAFEFNSIDGVSLDLVLGDNKGNNCIIKKIHGKNYGVNCQIDYLESSNHGESCTIKTIGTRNCGNKCTIGIVHGDNTGNFCRISNLIGGNYGKNCAIERHGKFEVSQSTSPPPESILLVQSLPPEQIKTVPIVLTNGDNSREQVMALCESDDYGYSHLTFEIPASFTGSRTEMPLLTRAPVPNGKKCHICDEEGSCTLVCQYPLGGESVTTSCRKILLCQVC